MTEPFPQLVERLTLALAGPLPGVDAQFRMAPAPNRGWSPADHPPEAREAAVLLALYPRDEQTTFVLIRRPSHLPAHPGQVSLPGGRVEPDEDHEQAALREAREELGPSFSAARPIGHLSPIWIPVSGFRVTTVVATLAEAPEFVPSEDEVESVHEVAVADLLEPARRRDGHVIRRDGGERTVPWFDLDGQTVWGATGMILAEFAELLEAL